MPKNQSISYDWFLLRSIVTAGYIGFMAYSADFVLRTHVFRSHSATSSPSLLGPAVAVASFTALATRFAIEHAPPTYYLYAAFPSFFFGSLLRDPWTFRLVITRARTYSPVRLALNGFLAIATLEIMVYGYMQRAVFSAIIVGMGVVWPVMGMDAAFRAKNASLLAAWASVCLLLAVFPLLPVEKGESLPVV